LGIAWAGLDAFWSHALGLVFSVACSASLLRLSSLQVHSEPAMKAIQIHETGGPEVLRLAEVPIPQPGAGRTDLEARRTMWKSLLKP